MQSEEEEIPRSQVFTSPSIMDIEL